MIHSNYVPLVEATRGEIVESVHFGAVAIADVEGKLVASIGDSETVNYLRSSAKPFQILPLVEIGGPDQFGLTERELAIMCASHAGTDDHASVIRSIHKKVGLSEQDLLCGTHPIDGPTGRAMLLRGEEPSPVRHNCSGKHTGMLVGTVARGLSKEDYINPEHPLQKIILKTFAEMVDVPVSKIKLGTDGCSAPVFAIPMHNAAYGYARLCDPSGLEATRAAACQRITHAMTSNPDMIAGPGQFDTVLMQVGRGMIVCKGGAEGYQSVGLLPGACGPNSPAMGIAIKISDGDAHGRARTLVAVELLRELGALSASQLEELADFYTRPLYNWRKIKVGELRPCFRLLHN